MLEYLGYASAREAVREEARARGLLQDPSSGWALDLESDRLWGYPVGLLGATVRNQAGVNGPITRCEQAAAHPYDVTRPTAAVSFDDLDWQRALKLCPADSASPRIQFLRARALSRKAEEHSNSVDLEEIFRLLISAAQGGLAISYNNLQAQLADKFKAYSLEETLSSTYAQMTLMTSYPDISPLLSAASKTEDQRRTFLWLAGKAAELGVPEAHRDLAKATGDQHVQAFHLTVAARLFEDAGRLAEAEETSSALEAVALSAAQTAAIRDQVEAWQPTVITLMNDQLQARILELILAESNVDG